MTISLSRWLTPMLFSCAVFAAVVPVVYAQPTKPQSQPDDSAAAAAAWAEADTGRMMPGYRDLSRYNSPGYCLMAMEGIKEGIWRRVTDEKRVRDTKADTLPTAAVTAGRACAAAFNPEQVAPRDLYNLMQLSVQVRDTTKLQAVVKRQLALAKTDEMRGYVLFDAMEALLDAHPIQKTLAATMVARLDSIGKGAAVPRMLAHQRRKQDLYNLNFDMAAIMEESQKVAEAEAMLTPEDRKEYKNGLGSIFNDSINLAWFNRHPNLHAEVLRLMQRRIDAVPEWSLSDMGKQWMLGRMELLADAIGKPAPPLDGKFWFPDTVTRPQPALGDVTLVFMVYKGGGIESDQIAMLRRLYKKYHTEGLEVVLVTKTEGFSWASPPQQPSDEAKTIAWYYQEYLKLPFKVLVDETPFTRRPDGRRVDGQIEFQRQYPTTQVMIGRDRKVYTLYQGLGSESELEAYIKQALAQPKVTASSE